ncbi:MULTISPECIES: Stk1 family PASTA domain-containing Ser/Thr kinase [Gardnerella]|jgi:kinase domain protein|uniref:non-specific serine/threonine protein kinase n=1 Tax=Gardnerella swidsinskii TaxID=2792979 RepID=A0ABM6GH44_9BIFI|nr:MULTISPECIES: Stk1 family PASTA domain-containing Ser/Thr kinase [Gardnerella]APW18077.1 serine/threonine protein kinase [Gardnerella vaginalis]RFT32784.1 serine/threonine protein kinase [Bifidobacteriaceae bacterium NR020]RIY29125.1 serine/threonine protein kinase [Bifidobacteriaceae bacterium NR016]MDK7093369.1 Stk1 family PASTA domain-containing Ser/Thr kinase [Gardnerella swidsinskii]MDK8691317.1 Stk1 family PASTA domain-containing Ser/Thr kinase [Gardnerella swidsinskii]
MNTTMPTSLANGRYELGELIGRGGMAEVRVAVDKRLGRTVAVKIMRSDLANDEIFLSRFRREAHAIAQMNNPNIVNIYDSGEESVIAENGLEERLPYLVMEYIKGKTLRDILKMNGALSQRDAEQVMLGVLNALEYSHRMGIIHRDIKPGNIMISEQGMVKVMDFGIARALDDSATTMTQSQGVVGTAQYLSPEQARGEQVDMRSDLYSAGCVLYEMLTGRPPFIGDSAVAIAYQHVSEVATPLSTLVPGMPAMWDKICAKAMAKDRQNRYATASEFKNDILAFMNGGVPVAAAFNPLTDLANMKARKQAEQDAATMAMGMTDGAATQSFNPITGQVESANIAFSPSTRASQRATMQAQRRKRVVIGSIVGVLVTVLVLLGVLFMLNRSRATGDVVVPTFMETTTQDAAREKLRALGLVPDIREDDHSSQPEGTFTKQSPRGGEHVASGSKVTVWFSVGPQSTRVPDVSGKTQEAARKMLERAGFKIANVRVEDSADIKKDHVTRTDPDADSFADKGTLITLYIASGLTKIPDGLVGQSKDIVVSQLENFGFTTDVVKEDSDNVPEGSVTRLNPSSGSSVKPHSSITVYVSQGASKVEVPSIDLGTVTFKQAKKILEAKGLRVVSDSMAKDDDIVMSMSEEAGSKVEKGKAITLVTRPSLGSSSDSD